MSAQVVPSEYNVATRVQVTSVTVKGVAAIRSPASWGVGKAMAAQSGSSSFAANLISVTSTAYAADRLMHEKNPLLRADWPRGEWRGCAFRRGGACQSVVPADLSVILKLTCRIAVIRCGTISLRPLRISIETFYLRGCNSFNWGGARRRDQ
jgi:hypothetical protein